MLPAPPHSDTREGRWLRGWGASVLLVSGNGVRRRGSSAMTRGFHVTRSCRGDAAFGAVVTRIWTPAPRRPAGRAGISPGKADQVRFEGSSRQGPGDRGLPDQGSASGFGGEGPSRLKFLGGRSLAPECPELPPPLPKSLLVRLGLGASGGGWGEMGAVSPVGNAEFEIPRLSGLRLTDCPCPPSLLLISVAETPWWRLQRKWWAIVSGRGIMKGGGGRNVGSRWVLGMQMNDVAWDVSSLGAFILSCSVW